MQAREVLASLGYDNSRSYGCAMLGVDVSNTDLVDPADLYYDEDLHGGGGMQDYKHVTLRYGITDPAVTLEHVNGLLENVPNRPDELLVMGAGVFPGPGYEVLKLEVDNGQNSWLYSANKWLQVLPGVNTFPDYVPHITLAYVRTGWAADNAVKMASVARSWFYTNDVTYSPVDTDEM